MVKLVHFSNANENLAVFFHAGEELKTPFSQNLYPPKYSNMWYLTAYLIHLNAPLKLLGCGNASWKLIFVRHRASEIISAIKGEISEIFPFRAAPTRRLGLSNAFAYILPFLRPIWYTLKKITHFRKFFHSRPRQHALITANIFFWARVRINHNIHAYFIIWKCLISDKNIQPNE